MSTAKEASILLFQQANQIKGVPHCALYADQLDDVEATLKRDADKARQEYEDFRRVRALRVALDCLMPGWRYVDASDYLPREKWNAFISNDPAEWAMWLTANGVPPDMASQMVTRTFERP